MANRFPLVLDTSDGNKIKEIPQDDNLNLRDTSIIDVQNINALGTISAAAITVNGEVIGPQRFLDLTDTPPTYEGSNNYIVKVNSNGTGLEFKPLDDIGDLDVEVLTATEILPTQDISTNIGRIDQRFELIHAEVTKSSIQAFDGTMLVDAETKEIPYSVLTGEPTFLSQFTNDVNFLTESQVGPVMLNVIDAQAYLEVDIQGSVFTQDSMRVIDGFDGSITTPSVITDILVLQPGPEPLDPEPGTITISDGVSWDPTGTGQETVLVFLNGVWKELLMSEVV